MMRRAAIAWAVGLVVGACGPEVPAAHAEVPTSPARDTTAAPAPTAPPKPRNAKFVKPGLDVPLWKTRFSYGKREIFVKRELITEAMTLGPGDRVADIGAGTGIFLDGFAKRVGPTGHVTAVEVSQPFVKALRKDFAGRTDVTIVQGEAATTTLPDASLDVAFLADTWHHMDQPAAMAADLARIVKPGGRLVVVELEKLEGLVSDWQLGHVHETRDEVVATLRRYGFSKGRILGIAGMKDNWAVELVRDGPE